METRTVVRQIEFRKPFRLAGLEELQPAGGYTLLTEQEMLDTTVSLGWRTTSATLEIFRDGATEHVSIDVHELREALARDAGCEPPPHYAPPHRRARDLMRRGGRR